jgi:hypothetical protein
VFALKNLFCPNRLPATEPLSTLALPPCLVLTCLGRADTSRPVCLDQSGGLHLRGELFTADAAEDGADKWLAASAIEVVNDVDCL